MKSCAACNAEIEEGFNFCKICGTDQNAYQNDLIKSNTTYLTILCILTIVGSLFGIARGMQFIIAGISIVILTFIANTYFNKNNMNI